MTIAINLNTDTTSSCVIYTDDNIESFHIEDRECKHSSILLEGQERNQSGDIELHSEGPDFNSSTRIIILERILWFADNTPSRAMHCILTAAGVHSEYLDI